MKQESELGRRLGGRAVCRGSQATEKLQVQPFPEAPAPRISAIPPPSDPTPLHNCTPGDDSYPFTCVCLYRDLATISSHTTCNFQLHQALSNTLGNKILRDLNSAGGRIYQN